MGRKVGSFIDPVTKEEHWMDVSTVKLVKLASETIRPIGAQHEFGKKVINFKLDNLDILNVITLQAEYILEGKTYLTKAVHFDENEFAKELANAVFSETIIDDLPYFAEAKKQAMSYLADEMLKQGMITSNLKLTGAGYVLYENDRTMTIDKMLVEVLKEGEARVTLQDCTGPTSLSQIPDPVIVFYTSEQTFTIDSFEVTESKEGRIKTYTINTEEIRVSGKEDEKMFKHFSSLDVSNDETIEEFIMNRRLHLDDMTSENSNGLDDRFADIF